MTTANVTLTIEIDMDEASLEKDIRENYRHHDHVTVESIEFEDE
jgi:hypothetical protein